MEFAQYLAFGIPPQIRWGIIGVGDVCEVKAGPAFQKCVGSSLQAVMRRTAVLAKDFAERHNVPSWCCQKQQKKKQNHSRAPPKLINIHIVTQTHKHTHCHTNS